MKRRITIEQLQELTEEQQQRLREWWKPQCYDVYINHYDTYMIAINDDEGNMSQYVTENKHRLLPLLSIGQMIELLEDKHGKDWIDRIYSVDYDHNIYSLYDGEFTDALWSEVKQVL